MQKLRFLMRWALILYDEDGFTSIEKSTSLTGNIKQTSVCKLKITNGQTYKVEILQLADTKAELNKYAKNWGLTHRALAIHNAIKKCKGSKKGGFLSVWPSDEENNIATDRGITPTSISTDLVSIGTTSPDITSSPTAIEGTSTNMDNIPANGLPRSEKIQGKNDRAITVLFEGAGDYTDIQADPCRS
ncbi:uncharacterized protein LOC132757355, partial [Ruditapes philippinarum]|uniref:uncharacterized protein LOC132757355 n=1 Tax=Ruditapes philippinarum TaxID=129788 RepID=UPI00295A84DF